RAHCGRQLLARRLRAGVRQQLAELEQHEVAVSRERSARHAMTLPHVSSRVRPDEEEPMARPITLFTGQWADLPLETLAEKVGGWDFDGLELACWGDHFEVDRALAEADYVQTRTQILERNGLQCFALGAHLVGQSVCDRIDERHRAILPPDVWGDG